MATPAEANYCAAGEIKHGTFRIDNFKITLDANRAVVADSYFRCCQIFLLD